MTGKSLGLTDRDRQVLSEVARLGALTRQQIERLGFFQSSTRAKARLQKLVGAGYLRARSQPLAAGGPRHVFLPGSSPTGRPLRDVSDLFLLHRLGLVDIRIAFESAGRLSVWTPDSELVGRKLEVVPDAYLEFEHGDLTLCAFVEYDRGTETLGRFERKVRGYMDLAFSGRFTRTFNRKFFRVFVVSDTAGRLDNLRAATARVTDRIFRFGLLSELQQQGPLASIWRRPGVATSESLIAS